MTGARGAAIVEAQQGTGEGPAQVADVFISYKKERRAYAERLAQVLEAHGYDVWWDYDLVVGPDFRDQIEAKLEAAAIVVVLWCSGAVRSKFVRSEANRADKRNKLIQAYIEWVEPPLGFEEAQGQPLVNWRGEAEGEVIAGLLEALALKLGPRRRMDNLIRLLGGLPRLTGVEPLSVSPDEAADSLPLDSGTGAEPLPGQGLVQISRPAASRWALIERSLNPGDYEDFLEVFGAEPEAFDARRHRRQLGDWGRVDQSSSREIEAYLRDPARGASLFAALQEHAKAVSGRAAAAELKAQEEREALLRAREAAEEAARKAEDERNEKIRLAAECAREVARHEQYRSRIERIEEGEFHSNTTANEWAERAREKLIRECGGRIPKFRPVQERSFPIELPGVAGWPNPQMVAIPPGSFLMGAPESEEGSDDRERPQHEVRIDYVFALGMHAVTFAEWDAALAAGAKLEKPDDRGWGRANRPVINVSWQDAQAYLAWLNGRLGLAGRADAWRLPSEAEWEYACRAGTTTAFSFGETISTAQANYDGRSTYGKGAKGEYRGKTMPVGSFPANAFGLHEMQGNLWEWCQDCWNANYGGAPVDGGAWTAGDCANRVLRGGSWDDIPQDLRSAVRGWDSPSYRGDKVGFRLSRTL